MKIFLSFLQSLHQHPIPAYSFWEFYIKNGIEEAGHSWIEGEDIDWAKGLVPQSKEEHSRWLANSWEKTLAKMKIERPDVFLSYLYPQQIDEQAIGEIRKLGIPCINFFCDNIREFQKIPKKFGVFDLNWVPEKEAIAMYKQAGINCIHLPMPMWVAPAYRTITITENSQISFIGSFDIQRLLLFEELAKSNIPLVIYGSGWLTAPPVESPSKSSLHFQKKLNYQLQFVIKYGVKAYLRKLQQSNIDTSISEPLKKSLRGKLDFGSYIRISKDSLITLGVNRYPSFNYPLHHPNTYSRLRDIEAPMLGACYLTEAASGLADLYEFGKDIEVYQDVNELVLKANLLSKNASLRYSMRKNAQKIALAEHSIPRSIDKLLIKLKR